MQLARKKQKKKNSRQPLILTDREWFPQWDFPLYVDGSLKPLQAGQISKDNYTFRLHAHEFYELVIILGGTGIQYVNEQNLQVSKGDIFVIRPGIPHCFSECNELAICNILFSMEHLPLPFDLLRKLPGFKMLFDYEPNLKYPSDFKARLTISTQKFSSVVNFIQQLKAEMDVKLQGYEAAALKILLDFFLFLGRNYQDTALEEHTPLQRLSKAIALMEKHYMESLTIQDIAQASFLSARNFQRLFQQATRTSPLAYLNELRLEHAARLLRENESSIIEISDACGFHAPSYFAKCFAKRYGMTPLKYRKGV